MREALRAGVVGAGVFGAHHARKYASLDGVELTAVLDPHADRTRALAGPLGATAFASLDAFLDAVDLVTVASPASSHAAIASSRSGVSGRPSRPMARNTARSWWPQASTSPASCAAVTSACASPMPSASGFST